MIKQVYYWLMGPLYRRLLQESESRVLQRFEAEYMATFEKRILDGVESQIATRVKSEVDARMAAAIKSNLEYQEKFATKFLDEIVGVYLELERFSALIGMDTEPANEQFSDGQIATLLKRITREAKITELAREYQVPIRDVLIWRSKYNLMDAATIGKVRALEKENASLRQAVEENSVVFSDAKVNAYC